MQILILFNQTILREEVRYCFEIKFPAERKRSGLPLPRYINFSPLTAISLEKITRLHREKYKFGYSLGKNAMIILFQKI